MSVLGLPLGARVRGEGHPDRGDLLVVAQIGDGDLLGPTDERVTLHADLEHRVGIEPVVLEVAVLARDAKLGRERPVDVLGAQILDAIALLLPVDQRAVEIGVVAHLLGVVGRDAERIAPTLERIGAPAVVAVIGVHAGHRLPGALDALAARAGDQRDERHLDGEVAAPEAGLAGGAHRLDRVQLVGAPVRLDVASDDLVDRHRVGGRAEEAGRGRQGQRDRAFHGLQTSEEGPIVAPSRSAVHAPAPPRARA